MESGNQRTDPARQQKQGLSPEEMQVMSECERDSFLKRGLPLGCATMLGIQYLVRTGKLSAHPKFGSLPKVIIGGAISYFIGKLSYIPHCRQKILEKIPDSNIAMAIKKHRMGPNQDNRYQQDSEDSQQSSGTEEGYGGFGMKLPSESPSYEGLNDSQRPSIDNEVKVPDAPEEKKTTTYEDLRRRNRQDHKDSMSAPAPPQSPGNPSYKDSPFMPQKAWPDKKNPSSSQEPSDSFQDPPKRKRTNMWGDVIDE